MSYNVEQFEAQALSALRDIRQQIEFTIMNIEKGGPELPAPPHVNDFKNLGFSVGDWVIIRRDSYEKLK
jgi:hypothetical protein